MSISITWWSTCTFLIMCYMIPGPSLSQDCSLEKMENVVIDMMRSLSKGIRGTEPIYTPTREACINVCCLEKNISGDRQCNLMIYDARRISQHPNCYLFYCPSKEACPVKPLKGLVSYRINRGIQILDSQLENYNSKGNSLSSQAAHFDLPNQAGHLNHTAALQKSATSQMSELIDHIEEHLVKIELHTQFPEDQEKKHPETLDYFPKQKITELLPTSAAHTFQFSTSSPPLPTMLPTTVSSAVPKNTSTQIPTTTAFITTDHMISNSRTVTEFARTSATTMKPIAISTDSTSGIALFSLSVGALLSKDSLAPFQNMQQDNRLLDSEAGLLHDVPKSKHAPQSGDKSGLIAALLFGIVSLLLVIALISRRMSQSLQRRRYNRLDYLINGMYADV
ncbi:MANSC domain-containing protein 1 [Dermochelys coriacea]|uniref:MANSC domain-containing protein 1 n=1 Tax=Dermochelys coriacea TaxID=27794 RepID=UPI0018E7C086|nr:MANSC domain-containing protein 1 [Dermochelys coriacea]XP_038243786.1 MANSC domain-containing protein 1 [Dermochelys coriacea]XP_038243791.1 MANSC domain-containing protein 1 [Dermochelys coriacea]